MPSTIAPSRDARSEKSPVSSTRGPRSSVGAGVSASSLSRRRGEDILHRLVGSPSAWRRLGAGVLACASRCSSRSFCSASSSLTCSKGMLPLALPLDLGDDVAVACRAAGRRWRPSAAFQTFFSSRRQVGGAVRAPAELAPLRLAGGVVRGLPGHLGERDAVLAGDLGPLSSLVGQRARLVGAALSCDVGGVVGTLTRIWRSLSSRSPSRRRTASARRAP